MKKIKILELFRASLLFMLVAVFSSIGLVDFAEAQSWDYNPDLTVKERIGIGTDTPRPSDMLHLKRTNTSFPIVMEMDSNGYADSWRLGVPTDEVNFKIWSTGKYATPHLELAETEPISNYYAGGENKIQFYTDHGFSLTPALDDDLVIMFKNNKIKNNGVPTWFMVEPNGDPDQYRATGVRNHAAIALYARDSSLYPNDLEYLQFTFKHEGLVDPNPSYVIESRATGTGTVYPIDFRVGDTMPLTLAENGNVGIGTSDPQAALDVQGNVELNGKVSIGAAKNSFLALHVNQDAWMSGIQITNRWVGDGDSGLLIYEGGAGDRTSFFISDPGVNMSILPGWDDYSSNSAVIIGKLGFNDPGVRDYRLWVEGDTNVEGAIYVNETFHTSDKKFKKDIKGIDSALSKITNIKGVSYEWKTDEFKDRKFSKGTHFGVIGQDVEKILPNIVSENYKGEKSVAYTELIPILIEAMKEQQETITALSDEVKELKREVKLKGSMAMADGELH